MTRSLSAIALLAFSACAVGPKYQRPEVEVPTAFRYTVSAEEAASIADLAWWEMYRDPILQGLIEESLKSNQDLRVAAARVAEFRARVGVAAADFYPQIGLGAAGAYGQQSAKNYVPGQGPSGAFAVNVGLSWELDIWGRVRNATDAARAQLLATEETRRGVVLSLVADVAQTYAELMELDVELEVARRNTVTRQGTLDLFTTRSQGGVGNDLEVNQARADLAVTAAAIPATERLIALKESQMAVLLGRPPGPIARAKAPARQIAPVLPMGVPAALLERRPDIRAAEGFLRAATSSVGVAVANRLPKLSLDGIIGLAGPSLATTFSPAGLLWSVGAGLVAPIFEGGRLSSEEEAAWANLDQFVARLPAAGDHRVARGERRRRERPQAGRGGDPGADPGHRRHERRAARPPALRRRGLELPRGARRPAIALQLGADARPDQPGPAGRHGPALPGAGRRLAGSRSGDPTVRAPRRRSRPGEVKVSRPATAGR